MRRPDGPYSFWEMKEAARHELRRNGQQAIRPHARVSIDNRHSCRECYCCACVEVLKECSSHQPRG